MSAPPSFCNMRSKGRISDYQQDRVFSCLPAWPKARLEISVREGLICLAPPVIFLRWNTEWIISGFYQSYIFWIISYIVLLSPMEKSVFGSLLSKSWPKPQWAGVGQRGLAAPSLAWRWLTLEQHFAADGFSSGRQNICLKSSNHGNISKSSN